MFPKKNKMENAEFFFSTQNLGCGVGSTWRVQNLGEFFRFQMFGFSSFHIHYLSCIRNAFWDSLEEARIRNIRHELEVWIRNTTRDMRRSRHSLAWTLHLSLSSHFISFLPKFHALGQDLLWHGSKTLSERRTSDKKAMKVKINTFQKNKMLASGHHRIIESLRLEKTTKITTHISNPPPPCPLVMSLSATSPLWIHLGTTTPPCPWTVCANTLPLFVRRNFS